MRGRIAWGVAAVTAALAAAAPGAWAAVGDLDSSFNLSPINNEVRASAVQANGNVLLAGAFTNVSGASRGGAARLLPGGLLDSGFASPNVNNSAASVAVRPNGKVLVGGNFTTVGAGNVSRVLLAQFNIDGTVDTGFNANIVQDAGYKAVRAIAVQPDGKVLIGGEFTSVGGQPRTNLARLNIDGSVDTGFAPNPDGSSVAAIALQADGKILVGGSFSNIAGGSRSRIARLNADGTLDTGFVPNANSDVYSLAVQADGKILLGGLFTATGGATRNYIARLNASGTLDTGFDPNPNGYVWSIAPQADGKVVLGGLFTQVAGQPRNDVARVNADGTLDSAFNPNVTYSQVLSGTGVKTVALQPDGKVVLGGLFDTVAGVTSASRSWAVRVYGGPPNAGPASVTATGGDKQASASWSAVPGEVSSYTATASPGGATCTATAPATGCTVTGLGPGTYTFTVQAANGFGPGASSAASAPVAVTASPDPAPTPTPTPTPTLAVAGLKAKVSKTGLYLTSSATVSGAGKVAQAATTGSGKSLKTWCRASATAAAAGTFALKCDLGRKGRAYLKKKALTLALTTTFTPTSGSAVKKASTLKLKRRR